MSVLRPQAMLVNVVGWLSHAPSHGVMTIEPQKKVPVSVPEESWIRSFHVPLAAAPDLPRERMSNRDDSAACLYLWERHGALDDLRKQRADIAETGIDVEDRRDPRMDVHLQL